MDPRWRGHFFFNFASSNATLYFSNFFHRDPLVEPRVCQSVPLLRFPPVSLLSFCYIQHPAGIFKYFDKNPGSACKATERRYSYPAPTRRSVVMTTRAEKCEEWKNLTPFPIPVGIISHSIEKKNRVQDTLGSHSIPIIYLISFRLLESCYYAKGNLFGISRTPGIFLLFGGHLTATE